MAKKTSQKLSIFEIIQIRIKILFPENERFTLLFSILLLLPIFYFGFHSELIGMLALGLIFTNLIYCLM